jgi:hypothetical protein
MNIRFCSLNNPFPLNIRHCLRVLFRQHFPGFVCVENDHAQGEGIKIKLLRGKELIADVLLLNLKGPTVLRHHRFKITVEPNFGIERID